MADKPEQPTILPSLEPISEQISTIYGGEAGTRDYAITYGDVVQQPQMPIPTEQAGPLINRLSSEKTVSDALMISSKGKLQLGAHGFQKGKGMWAGRDGNVYKLFVGDNDGNSVSFDGTDLTSSSLILNTKLTAGSTLQAGWQTALSPSDGKVYPTRLDSISSTNTTIYGGPSVASQFQGPFLSFDMSETVKVAVCSGNDNNKSVVIRLPIDPTDPTATAGSSADIETSSEAQTDAFKIDATQLFVASVGTSGSQEVYGRIISGLDTTITVGTAATLYNGDSSSTCCEQYNSSTALVFYNKNTSPFTKVFGQNPTWSGTTVSAGTETELFTAGAAVEVKGAYRFGSSNSYILTYTYSNQIYARLVSFDGSSWTVSGTETALGTNTAGEGWTSALHIDDTNIIVFYNDGTNIEHRLVTLSNGALSFGSATAIQSATNTDDYPGIYKFSGANAILTVANSTNVRSYMLGLSGTTFTTLGSTLDVSAGGGPGSAVAVKHSATHFILIYSTSTPAILCVTINCANNYDEFIGFATADVDAEVSTDITYNGLVKGLSGLTTSTTYYVGPAESLTTYDLSQGRVGKALSSTSLIIQK